MNLNKLREAIRIIKKVPAKKLDYRITVVNERGCGCAGAHLGKKWNKEVPVKEGLFGPYKASPIYAASDLLKCSLRQEDALFFECEIEDEFHPKNRGPAYKSWWLKRARKIVRQVQAHRARARKQTLGRAFDRMVEKKSKARARVQ